VVGEHIRQRLIETMGESGNALKWDVAWAYPTLC
jgi:hypothetical protein